MKSFLKWIFVPIFLVSFVVACNQLRLFGDNDFSDFSSLPIANNVSIGIPDINFLYVDVGGDSYFSTNTVEQRENNPTGQKYALYQRDEDITVNCSISADRESTEDLYCTLDVVEGDLWFHALPLEYNVPPGMCDYLAFQVHWHFNQPVAVGPEIIYECEAEIPGAISTSPTTTAASTTETRYCLNGCALDATSVAGICNNSFQGQESVEDFCATYDKSDQEGLGNCCFGDYVVRDKDDTEVDNGDWGGKLKECIGGVARFANWDGFTKEDEVPIPLVYETLRAGLKQVFTIPALKDSVDPKGSGKTLRPYSLPTANYWDGSENGFATNPPKFYVPPNSPSEGFTPFQYTGYPYLTWTCLDQAREIKHQIHLIIREWNTVEEFDRLIDSEGSRGDPDKEGNEGTNCDYYEAEEKLGIIQFTDCNDIYDADDFIKENKDYPEIFYE